MIKNNEKDILYAVEYGQLDILKYYHENSKTNNIFSIVVENYDRTLLHIASRGGHYEVAEYLCKNGASVIDKDKFECSSLFFAAGSGNLKLVQYLCENGANIVDDRNNESWTPQYNACYNKHYDIMKYLCEKGADINAKTSNGVTLLHRACIDGTLDAVKYLCENNAQVNARNMEGNTPLISFCYDCRNFNIEIVRYLHKNGADLNATNNEGFFPLFYAILFCNTDLLTYLLSVNDIDLNLKDKNGNTALHKASDMGAIVLIELLCEKNIEINLKNKLGLQAVYLACVKEHYDAMRYLLSKGADINSQGVNGNTLLHHVIIESKISETEFLCKNTNININLQNNFGSSPLHYAFLCEAKANVNLKDSIGRTPSHIAAQYNSAHVLELLKKHGADFTDFDTQGNTPLHYASRNGSSESTRYICRTGKNLKNQQNLNLETPRDLAFKPEIIQIIDFEKEILSEDPKVYSSAKSETSSESSSDAYDY